MGLLGHTVREDPDPVFSWKSDPDPVNLTRIRNSVVLTVLNSARVNAGIMSDYIIIEISSLTLSLGCTHAWESIRLNIILVLITLHCLWYFGLFRVKKTLKKRIISTVSGFDVWNICIDKEIYDGDPIYAYLIWSYSQAPNIFFLNNRTLCIK